MPGPPPVPTNVRLLHGNPSRRPVNDREPRPAVAPADIPPPDWMNHLAADRWRKLAPELVRHGLLTVLDLDMLEVYCVAYARWREAEGFLARAGTTVTKSPSGYIQQLPQVAIARGAAEQMRRVAAEFGLTPASRSRLVSSLVEPGEENAIAALMARRKQRDE